MTEISKEEIKEFNPVKDNPCWKCPYRADSKYDWHNVCLLDEKDKCVREE